MIEPAADSPASSDFPVLFIRPRAARRRAVVCGSKIDF
jgi:hypothetical protein